MNSILDLSKFNNFDNLLPLQYSYTKYNVLFSLNISIN